MNRRRFLASSTSMLILTSGCIENDSEPQNQGDDTGIEPPDANVEEYTPPWEEDEQQQGSDESQREPTPSVGRLSGQTSPERTTDEMIEQGYRFSYGGREHTFIFSIPRDVLEYYESRRRVRYNYGVYVDDNYDDFLIESYVEEFKSYADRLGYNDGQLVNLIISFVQQLEYASDRVNTGFNEYPKYPVETLSSRRGDCEDSAILLSSLLTKLGYGTVLLLMPNDAHAALGIKGSNSLKGAHYNYEGDRYYYVETTAPGWNVGQVPPRVDDGHARITPIGNAAVIVFSWGAVPEPGGLEFEINAANEGGASPNSAEVIFEVLTRDGVFSRSREDISGLSPASKTSINGSVDAPADKDLKARVSVSVDGYLHDRDESEWRSQ